MTKEEILEDAIYGIKLAATDYSNSFGFVDGLVLRINATIDTMENKLQTCTTLESPTIEKQQPVPPQCKETFLQNYVLACRTYGTSTKDISDSLKYGLYSKIYDQIVEASKEE